MAAIDRDRLTDILRTIALGADSWFSEEAVAEVVQGQRMADVDSIAARLMCLACARQSETSGGARPMDDVDDGFELGSASHWPS